MNIFSSEFTVVCKDKEEFSRILLWPRQQFTYEIPFEKDVNLKPHQYDFFKMIYNYSKKHGMGRYSVIFRVEGIGEIQDIIITFDKLLMKDGVIIMKVEY